MMLQLIYYELNDIEGFEAQLDANIHYIATNRRLSEDRKAASVNFLKAVQRLYILRQEKKSAKHDRQLTAILEEKHLLYRDWLLLACQA